jgi:hypothetical protein
MTHQLLKALQPQAAKQGCCPAKQAAQQAMQRQWATLHLSLQAVQAEVLWGLLQAVLVLHLQVTA